MIEWPLLGTVNLFHLTSAVIWLGGLAGYLIFVAPPSERRGNIEATLEMDFTALRRLRVISYTSMGVQAVTGIVMLLSNRNYSGFLEILNPWTVIILVKHLAAAAMLLVSVYLFEVTIPEMKSYSLKNLQQDYTRSRLVQIRLLRMALAIAAFILLMTALATAISALGG